MPRVNPPRTVEHGLFNMPTVLNNVETYCNVPPIIINGSDWYKQYGPENNHGTKAFALQVMLIIQVLLRFRWGQH